MVCWQSCFRWCCWCWFTGFRILCGLFLYALANDAKAVKKGGEMQFNGLGLIMVYRGLYFGMYDSSKSVVLTGNLQVKFWLSVQILLASYSTTFFGERFNLALYHYPIDTGRRRMMMTSGEAV
ncbi:unnamed protein product [Musa acuminata subsp. burmannicoides]